MTIEQLLLATKDYFNRGLERKTYLKIIHEYKITDKDLSDHTNKQLKKLIEDSIQPTVDNYGYVFIKIDKSKQDVSEYLLAQQADIDSFFIGKPDKDYREFNHLYAVSDLEDEIDLYPRGWEIDTLDTNIQAILLTDILTTANLDVNLVMTKTNLDELVDEEE